MQEEFRFFQTDYPRFILDPNRFGHKIEKVETINLGGHSDVPGEAVMIIKASIKD